VGATSASASAIAKGRASAPTATQVTANLDPSCPNSVTGRSPCQSVDREWTRPSSLDSSRERSSRPACWSDEQHWIDVSRDERASHNCCGGPLVEALRRS
jgi:hypothetical protein